MSNRKNRAKFRYEPEDRKGDSKRYKQDRRERSKFSVRLVQQTDGAFWGKTS